MCRIAYKGPAIVMAIGGSFALLGAIPVAITMAIGVKNSATVIGMGFIGFGLLVIIPGMCWFIIMNHRRHSMWRLRRCQQGQEETPALQGEGQQIQYGGMENEVDDIDKAPPDSETEPFSVDIQNSNR